MDFGTLLLDIGKGIVVGGGYALLGYFTKARSAGEPFEGAKAVPAVITGALLGAVAPFAGIDPLDTANAEAFVSTYVPFTFVVFVIDYVSKGVWNLIQTKLLKRPLPA